MAHKTRFSISSRSSGSRSVPGGAPGELEPATDQAPLVRCIGYGPEGFAEHSGEELDLAEMLKKWPVSWIDIDGPPNQQILDQLQQTLGVHPLALEDVIDQGQRPKVERYLDRHFIVVHMITLQDSLQVEQLSLYLDRRYVLTFQGTLPSDSLEPVRERIRSGKGRIRTQGSDYLTYALLDSVVDHYFPVAERLGARLAELETAVLRADRPNVMVEVQALKRDLFQFRRVLWPLGEALDTLNRSKDVLLTKETRLFLRDCRDHVSQLKDMAEVYRDTADTLVETYLSVLSNKTNDVMRFLTLIATVFIPLTFVAGVYGMNFDTSVSAYNMPELKWKYGYPAVLGAMLLIALGLSWRFRSRRWFR